MMMLNAILLCAFVHLGQSVWIKEMENPHLWQGDVVLDPDEKLHINQTHTFASVSIKGGRWPGGVIAYEIGSDIGSKGVAAINAAFADYHKYTCIKFKRRSSEREYIHFYKGGGCSSPVGWRSGRANRISLAEGCWYKGVVQHEVGHSLGLHHEQCHPDRDNYVTIVWENLFKGVEFNFYKQTRDSIDTMGTPYDLDSMMHYGSIAFSKNGERTIETKKCMDRLRIGNLDGFSKLDVVQLNLMYKCPVDHHEIPKKPCVDKIDYCDSMIRRGYCGVANRETWMFDVCCKACHAAGSGCGGPGGSGGMPKHGGGGGGGGGGGSGCSDEDKNCPYWARRGFCRGSHGAWMRKHCCKSCTGK